MSLRYEPSSELLHISEQQLFPGHAWTVLDTRAAVSGTRMTVSSKYEYLVPDREVARGVDAHPSVIPLPSRMSGFTQECVITGVITGVPLRVDALIPASI